jgi:hypothetical protein
MNDMRFAFLMMTIGVSATPVCISVGASLYGANGDAEPENRAPTWTTIERAHKSDRLTSFVTTAANISGLADSTFAAIEVAGPLASAIVVRDQNGRVLYSADPATRTTLIAKRPASPASPPPNKDREIRDPKEASPPREIPEGCEGAFSPYAAPRMAHVIGRCISGIVNDRQVASAQ